MRGLVKVLIVLAGYAIAVVAGALAWGLRFAETSGPDASASQGMSAFGDLVVFVAVFGLVAILPTLLALYFLRAYPLFWTGLSYLALLVALTGALAAALHFTPLSAAAARGPLIADLALASPLRLLISPLFALAIGLCWLTAPFQRARSLLLAATAIEAASGLPFFVRLFSGLFAF